MTNYTAREGLNITKVIEALGFKKPVATFVTTVFLAKPEISELARALLMLIFGRNQVQVSMYGAFYGLVDASSTPAQFTVVSTLATFLITLGWLGGLWVKSEHRIIVIKAVFSFFSMQTVLKNLPSLYQTCLKYIQKDPYKDCKTLCKSAEELYNNQLRLTMKAKSDIKELQVPSYSEDIKYGKSRKLGRTEELMKYMGPFELGPEELENNGIANIAKPQPLRKKLECKGLLILLKNYEKKILNVRILISTLFVTKNSIN